MSQPAVPVGTVRIAPPMSVRISAGLIIAEAAGVVALAVVIVASGVSHDAAAGQLLAQGAYYVVLALLMALCGIALWQGRRWGRTPTIVVQIVLLAVAYWMAVPGGRLLLGLALVLVALLTGGLLVSRSANDWVGRFPSPFGPERDR